MRIYFAIDESLLCQLADESRISLERVQGLLVFAQTAGWLSAQAEQDPEVLADQILHETASAQNQARFVLVAEVSDSVVSAVPNSPGQVCLAADISLRQIAAIFVADASGELSWYGPTELQTVLDLTD
ncbi:MAG: hypothetical protein EBS36_02305 [Actinobacteria bacterium]|nr:hypothetical protein [Actinomycetota bacterium]NBY15160.1 hypothetical protein [Actinomycetota bacterium]